MPEKAAEWDEVYDQESDVYYVSFGTGEPSFCVEVDDVLVVEVGLFSNLPTGYRLLNKSNIATRKMDRPEIKKLMRETLRSLREGVPTLDTREVDVERSLDKVLA